MVATSKVVFALVAGAAGAAAGDPNSMTKEDYNNMKAAEAAAKAAEAAREAKKAAFNKVVTMLEDLTSQVMEEGEKEAATYSKFACFCKDTTAEKVDQIQGGKDDKASLETHINELNLKRGNLDDQIAAAQLAITDAEAAMHAAEESRAAESGVYQKNSEDLKGALFALKNAVATLKASAKAPSLVQMQSMGSSIRSALLLADAMGLGGASTKRAAAVFLQQAPGVPMQDYDFHSGDIIATLEGLNDDFRTEKADIDAEEVAAVAAHDSFIQEKTDFVKDKTNELEAAQESKSLTIEAIGGASEELSTTSAVLLDNQQYLDELSQMCHHKALTWDQRSQLRADELSALKSVMDIVQTTISNKTSSATIRFVQQGVGMHFAEAVARDAYSMQAIEAEAEQADSKPAPIGFLQQRLRSFAIERHEGAPPSSAASDGRDIVVQMLMKQGTQLKSTLLTSLASKITADPFVKIKKLIQELIERLLQEAGNESNQKSWCDKATKDAEQKRAYAAGEILSLNAQMTDLEALRDQLAEEIGQLAKEISELETARNTGLWERAEEKAENVGTVREANEGLSATNMVIDILEKFYATAGKETVALGLLQRGPMDDAPDAGFKNGEAYQGQSSTAGGIVGMFEVIKSDFERTIAETEFAEKQAEDDFLKFMTETGMSLVKKQTAHNEKVTYHEDAVEKLAAANANLASETEVLKTSIMELLDLKPVCIDTGMTYEERVARREDEIKALNKALCILEAYAEYGPGGTGNC